MFPSGPTRRRVRTRRPTASRPRRRGRRACRARPRGGRPVRTRRDRRASGSRGPCPSGTTCGNPSGRGGCRRYGDRARACPQVARRARPRQAGRSTSKSTPARRADRRRTSPSSRRKPPAPPRTQGRRSSLLQHASVSYAFLASHVPFFPWRIVYHNAITSGKRHSCRFHQSYANAGSDRSVASPMWVARTTNHESPTTNHENVLY